MSNLSKRLSKVLASLTIASLLSTFLVVGSVSADVSSYAQEAADYLEIQEDDAHLPGSRYEAAVLIDRTFDLPSCEDEMPFDDVEADHWAYDAVMNGFCGGIFFGEDGTAEDPSDTFNGAEEINRAEFTTMVVRALGLAASVDADDESLPSLEEAGWTDAQEAEVSGEWYEAYTKLAFRAGLIRGFASEGNVLGMDRLVLKQDAAVVLCRGVGVCETPEVEEDEDDEPTRDTSFDSNGGTEGSIEEVVLGSRDETEALEGEEEVEIYAIDFELDDNGPLQLQRLDVIFGADGAGDSTKPWDYFEEVSVAVEGDVVATMEADNSSDWSDDLTGNLDQDGDASKADADGDEYRLRFTGLSETLVSDDTTKVSVLVTMRDVIDSDDEDTVWFLVANEVRVMDETGVVTTEGIDDNPHDLQESFDLDEELSADFDARVADAEIDAQVVQVDETNDTNGVVIYAFELEENEGIDATLTELESTFRTGVGFDVIDGNVDIDDSGAITVADDGTACGFDVIDGNVDIDDSGAITGADDGTACGFDVIDGELDINDDAAIDATDDLAYAVNNVIQTAYLYADGEEVGQETVPATGGVTFDNMEVSLPADSTVQFEVVVDLHDTNDGARYVEGTPIEVTVEDAFEIEDTNGNDEIDIDGLALDSETHELRTEGVIFEFVSASTSKTPGDAAGPTADLGTFEIVFTATAFGEDQRLNDSCEEEDDPATNEGAIFNITNDNYEDCTLEASDSDSEDVTGTVWELDENQTRTFTLTVNVEGEDSSKKLLIDSFTYGVETNGSADTVYNFDMDDYKTGNLYLSDNA